MVAAKRAAKGLESLLVGRGGIFNVREGRSLCCFL